MEASPYVLPFVRALEEAGHTVSVIVPNTQRSWIGKAHIVGQDVQATHYWPPKANPEAHSPAASANDDGSHPWVLVNSTPASCAQLGLGSYFFQDRGPIHLVISGPNYGRNTTAVFALSSGTLGAALESAVCGYRAIALSFAFFERNTAADIVDEACKHSVRVCEWVAKNAEWGGGRLYSVNTPLKKGVSDARIVWTKMLQNEWKKGACFEELPPNSVPDPGEAEARLRRQESSEGANSGTATPSTNDQWKHRHFKWAPRFTDVYDSVLKAGPGSDGWAVKEGETSITAIIANFMAAGPTEGEVKL